MNERISKEGDVVDVRRLRGGWERARVLLVVDDGAELFAGDAIYGRENWRWPDKTCSPTSEPGHKHEEGRVMSETNQLLKDFVDWSNRRQVAFGSELAGLRERAERILSQPEGAFVEGPHGYDELIKPRDGYNDNALRPW